MVTLIWKITSNYAQVIEYGPRIIISQELDTTVSACYNETILSCMCLGASRLNAFHLRPL